MKAVEFLTEAKTLTPEEFNEYVDSFIQGFKPAVAMRKILASQYSEMFRDAYSTDIYRAWYVSETMARKIEGGWYFGAGKNRKQQEPQSVTVNIKSPMLSFSWTKAGAKQVATDDRYSGGVTIITKQKLQSPNDVLFNVYQYGRESLKKLKVKPIEKPLIQSEREVVLKSSKYYLTINPEDVIFMDKL